MKCQQCGKERPVKWRSFPFCSEQCRSSDGRRIRGRYPMKISELVIELRSIQAQYGDVEVFVVAEEDDVSLDEAFYDNTSVNPNHHGAFLAPTKELFLEEYR